MSNTWKSNDGNEILRSPKLYPSCYFDLPGHGLMLVISNTRIHLISSICLHTDKSLSLLVLGHLYILFHSILSIANPKRITNVVLDPTNMIKDLY